VEMADQVGHDVEMIAMTRTDRHCRLDRQSQVFDHDGKGPWMTGRFFDIPERKWFVIPSNSRGLIIFVKN